MEKTDGEIKIDDVKPDSTVSKYDHRHTLIKLAKLPCPTPRKTRFPMLQLLNEEIITVIDVQSIMIVRNLKDILPRPGEEREKELTKPLERTNKNKHDKLVDKYKKRRDRQIVNLVGFRDFLE